MRKLIITMLVLLIAAGLVACGRTDEKNNSAQVAKRMVKDDAERTVNIPAQPKRVIALNSSSIDMYYGAGGEVIAKPATVILTREIMEKVKDLPNIGEAAAPSVEKIISLNPDLVLGLNLPFHQNLVGPLEQAGVPILLQSLGNYEDIIKRLEFYGELSSKPAEAKKTTAALNQKLDAALKKRGDIKTPRVLLLFGTPDNYMMALPESFPGNLINMLKADNIAAGEKAMSEKMPYVAFSMEFVVKANPDIILLIMHGSGEEGEKMKDTLSKNSAWQGIKAVKDGKVYILPYHLFGINPGVQVGESIEYLGEVLYGKEQDRKNERIGG